MFICTHSSWKTSFSTDSSPSDVWQYCPPDHKKLPSFFALLVPKMLWPGKSAAAAGKQQQRRALVAACWMYEYSSNAVTCRGCMGTTSVRV
jgi:hypothetical protein